MILNNQIYHCDSSFSLNTFEMHIIFTEFPFVSVFNLPVCKCSQLFEKENVIIFKNSCEINIKITNMCVTNIHVHNMYIYVYICVYM